MPEVRDEINKYSHSFSSDNRGGCCCCCCCSGQESTSARRDNPHVNTHSTVPIPPDWNFDM